jgi:hypothetical protein
VDYNEYKAPKRNHRFRILMWSLTVLNVACFIFNIFTGSLASLWAIIGLPCCAYTLYMHHVKGFDPWN